MSELADYLREQNDHFRSVVMNSNQKEQEQINEARAEGYWVLEERTEAEDPEGALAGTCIKFAGKFKTKNDAIDFVNEDCSHTPYGSLEILEPTGKLKTSTSIASATSQPRAYDAVAGSGHRSKKISPNSYDEAFGTLQERTERINRARAEGYWTVVEYLPVEDSQRALAGEGRLLAGKFLTEQLAIAYVEQEKRKDPYTTSLEIFPPLTSIPSQENVASITITTTEGDRTIFLSSITKVNLYHTQSHNGVFLGVGVGIFLNTPSIHERSDCIECFGKQAEVLRGFFVRRSLDLRIQEENPISATDAQILQPEPPPGSLMDSLDDDIPF